MRLRYRTACLALLAFPAALLGCTEEPPPPLVGTWQDARWADTVDVFRRRYTFEGDGTLTIRMRRPPASDTLFHATYVLEHDSLLTLEDEGGSEQFVAHVRGDSLLLRTPEMSTTLLRVAE